MLKLLLYSFCIMLLLPACKLARPAAVTTKDTLTMLKPVSVPYDTNFSISFSPLMLLVPIMYHDSALCLPDTTIVKDGYKISVGIAQGKIRLNVQKLDTALTIKGNAKAIDTSKTIVITHTVTKTKKENNWSLFWIGFAAGLCLAVIILAVIYKI